MKHLIFYTLFSTALFSGCKGQEKKDNLISKESKFKSIEERQKESVKTYGSVTAPTSQGMLNFRRAAKRATPGVVHIKSTFSIKSNPELPDLFRDFFGDDFFRKNVPKDNIPRVERGSASGVIVTVDGFIVTNNHVVDNAEELEIVLHDQRIYKARVIGTDPATDLALLKIEEKDLSFVEFGNSDSVEVGDMVLAVGNPFNLASTVTAGIVSAKARNINILTDRAAIESYIQTDAAVNSGNSGGALVDVNGRLIGINSAISTPTGVYAGYSFAIPVEIVKKTIDDLLRYGKVMRGYLGVIISDMNGQKAKALGLDITNGVMVDSLQENGAAKRDGINVKDIIIKLDSRKVSTSTELRELITRHKPGEQVRVTLIRDGKEKTVTVTLMPLQETLVSKDTEDILQKLGIEVEKINEKDKHNLGIDGGVIILRISKGIISFYTNMREGFIVTKVNGKRIRNIEEFIQELRNSKGGTMLEGVYPDLPGIYYYAFGL
jgi:serine protease Do